MTTPKAKSRLGYATELNNPEFESITVGTISQVGGNQNNVGTINATVTGATAREYGTDFDHVTNIHIATFAFPAVAAGDHSYGTLLYSFPPGVVQVTGSRLAAHATASVTIQGDAPNIFAGVGQSTDALATGTAFTAITATMQNVLVAASASVNDAEIKRQSAAGSTAIIQSVFPGVGVARTNANYANLYLNIGDSSWSGVGTVTLTDVNFVVSWKYLGPETETLTA